jgi:hypothetical protein
MASRRNPEFARAEAKSRSAIARKGWDTRRKMARSSGASIAISRDREARADAPGASPAVDLAAIISASLGDIVRGDMVAFREELTKRGDGPSARRMTRIIADFDFLSRGIARSGGVRP